jgi:flagellar biosynthesis protein FlhG
MGDLRQFPGQAAGLARRSAPGPVKVIAVTGGKGGVGKTCVATNLGVALAARGLEVMLLDADLGLANADVLLGLAPRRTLAHVLAGSCALEDVVVTGPRGLKLVPAASGVAGMADLGNAEHAGIIHAFSELAGRLDVLLVDTAAGLSRSVTTFARAAHHVLVVVCDEPASITDAYAVIKVLSRDHGVRRFELLASQVRSAEEGRALYEQLRRVCDRFLDVTLAFAGAVPHDERLRQAVRLQQPVVEAFPGSPAALALKNLAGKADMWVVPGEARGHLEFFVERLVGSQPPAAGAMQ